MKFLIVNTDYPEFLRWFYTEAAALKVSSYDEQMWARNESLFGLADFYSSNLRGLGHEAQEVYANNEWMQQAWLREHGRAHSTTSPWRSRWLRLGPRRDPEPSWMYEILALQIKAWRPDVLLNQAMDGISSRFVREMRPYVRLMVGQHAAPFPEGGDVKGYDLIISSLPNLVERFRGQGIPTQLLRLAFEPRVLDRLPKGHATMAVSFVGSLTGGHGSRIRLIDQLCAHLDIDVWGPSLNGIPDTSPIRHRYRGPAWSLKMYEVLRGSRITVNHHIDMAGPYANNMRLFEATGVGTLLVTDAKVNLASMFEPGQEVVPYASPEECVEVLQHFLKREEERQKIASAGQQHTLRHHTYHERMKELIELVRRYV